MRGMGILLHLARGRDRLCAPMKAVVAGESCFWAMLLCPCHGGIPFFQSWTPHLEKVVSPGWEIYIKARIEHFAAIAFVCRAAEQVRQLPRSSP